MLCAFLLEKDEQKKDKKKKKKEEPSSTFQRHRVDMLLGELSKKYPPHIAQPQQPEVKGMVLVWEC
jgi:mediator of RNA polymerase II transcription subunit 6